MNFNEIIVPAKESKFQIHLFNVKLRSNNRSGDKAYREIVKALHEQKVSINTYSDKAMQLRTQFGANSDVIYGKMVYYTNLESDQVYNDVTNNIEPHNFDVNIHPNPRETSYFFVPAAHRFAIIVGKGLSEKGVAKFLQVGIEKVIPRDEEIEVFIEQANDGFDLILQAEEVKRIEIKLSYSNNDKSDDFQEFLDEDMKEGNINDLTLIAKGDGNSPIEIKKSKVLTGALKLSQSNGNATANIIDKNKKSSTVNTNEYTRKEVVESNGGNEHHSVYDKIMKLFRSR